MFNNPNVSVYFNTETVDIVSNEKGQMSGLKVRNVTSGEERQLEVRGLFYGIGHRPNSQLLEGQVELDDAGYVIVKDGSTDTSVEGVYAAGDLQVPTTLSTPSPCAGLRIVLRCNFLCCFVAFQDESNL